MGEHQVNVSLGLVEEGGTVSTPGAYVWQLSRGIQVPAMDHQFVNLTASEFDYCRQVVLGGGDAGDLEAAMPSAAAQAFAQWDDDDREAAVRLFDRVPASSAWA